VPPDQNRPQDPTTYAPAPKPLDAGTASTTLSTSSGVVLSGPGSVHETPLRAANDPRIAASLSELSPIEVAGFVESFWLTRTPAPPRVTTRARLTEFEVSARNLLAFGKFAPDKEFNDLGHGVRHQWPICGGEGGPGRGPSFRGYLFLCLRDSGFVR
jgi:hypothetical protein